MDDLTPNQERFCREYIIDLNGTQAAIRAGYSENGASVQASTLLAIPKVKAFIDALKTKRATKLEIKAEDVLAETERLAMSDIGEAFNDDGSLKPIKDMPPHIRRAISSIEVDELFHGSGEQREQVGYTKKIKLWDKVKTLQLLGQHMKLFKEHVEHSADESLEKLIAETFKPKSE